MRDIALLICFCLPVFFVLLGHRELGKPDEGRYAEIPREMAESGDWVIPHLDGVVYLEKPPFVYWIVAGSRALFGGDEFALRLPVALFAALGVLLTYATGRRLFGHSEGFLAALVLGTSLCYVALGRVLILDMVVSVLMSGALACFILAIQEPPGKWRRWLFYGLYAFAALATLAKGLIGFLVPGAIMFLWLLGGNQWRRLRPFYLPTGALLFLAIAGPWHVLAALRNADWAQFYFVHEHWLRYTTSIHDRAEPWWYFVPVLIFGFFPWIGFLPRAVRSAWSNADADKRERATTGFLLTWAGFIFVFFSLSSSKLAPYILPMFPALALLVGRWLGRRLPQEKRTGGLAIFCGLALVLGLAVVLVVSRPGGPIDAELLPQARPFLYLAAAALFSGAVVVSLAGWRVTRVSIGAIVATIMVLTVSLELLAPQLVRPGTKTLSGFFLEHRQPGDQVYHYHNYFHDFSYYTESLVGTVDFTGELELQIDPSARDSGRFIDDAALRQKWTGDGRVWVVVYHKQAADLLNDTLFQDCIVAESPGYVLLCNRFPDSLTPSTHESSDNRGS